MVVLTPLVCVIAVIVTLKVKLNGLVGEVEGVKTKLGQLNHLTTKMEGVSVRVINIEEKVKDVQERMNKHLEFHLEKQG